MSALYNIMRHESFISDDCRVTMCRGVVVERNLTESDAEIRLKDLNKQPSKLKTTVQSGWKYHCGTMTISFSIEKQKTDENTQAEICKQQIG